MKKENISNALNNIDFDMVEDAYESIKQKKKNQKVLWHKWVRLAACLTLTIMIMAAVVALSQNIPPSVSTPGTQIDKTNPSSTDAVGTEPIGTEPIGTEPVGTEPVGTEPIGTEPVGTEPVGTQVADPSTYAPKVFTGIEEFVAYEKSLGEISSECYYIPSALGDDYELYSILRQEKNPTITYEHITIKYKLKGADIDEDSFIDLRTKTISCEYSVREYSDIAFESYTNNGFESFEYGGRQLYKKDMYSADNTTLLSYRVIFRIDGHLIGMHLPAIDSFENMVKYTDVIRVGID